MVRRVRFLAALVATLPLLSRLAVAQVGGGPVWIALDQSPPGTPPTVTFDSRSSDPTKSFFDVFLHGFYIEAKVSPQNMPFTKISAPGMDEIGQTGAPNLPAVQFRLALPPGIQGVHLAQASVMASTQYVPPSPCWPRTIPERDDENGTPEQFIQDPAIYALTTPWPAMDADAAMPSTHKLGAIMGTNVKVYPFRLVPAVNLLQISTHLRLEYDHDGVVQVSPEITRPNSLLAAHLFDNWGVVGPSYPMNPVHYNGYYLIICQNFWKSNLQPLIDQKSARGFWVDIDYISGTGNTCQSIRNLIQTWWNSTPHEADHYCLLVGEPDVIPMCSAPVDGSPPTDDLYGSMDGDDLDEEVYVGRLSVYSDFLAGYQANKIVNYMDHPPYTSAFTRALLIAHEQDAPGKYEGCMESVRLGSYSHPPTFVPIYGSGILTSNMTVSNEINAGCGLVCYRGHGSSNAWAAWNGFGEWYTTTDVSNLTNTVTPVVWNIACSNHDLSFNESLGEWWMESAPRGGVSSYGATVPSYTDENHELARQLFSAVYDLDITTQSHAIKYAEAMTSAIVRPYNAWLYCLLGDPEMPIRRDTPPPPWVVYKPFELAPCAGPNCGNVAISVFNAGNGQAVSDARVSLWKKPPPPPLPPPGSAATPVRVEAVGDEVFDNRYTNAAGGASIPAAPATPGMLYITIQDDFGNTQLDSIPVVSQASVGPAATPEFRFAATPTVARGSTRFQFGRPLGAAGQITIVDASGRHVRTLSVASGATAAEWRADDDAGRALRPGLYLARFSGEGRFAIARVAVLR